MFHGAGKDLGKLFLVHWLQQILERTHVKGVEHIPLIAGHKDNDRLGGRIALPDLAGQRHTVRAGGVQLNVQKEQVNSPVVCEAVPGRSVLHNLAGAVLRPDQGCEVGAGWGFIITNCDSYHGDIPLPVYSFK